MAWRDVWEVIGSKGDVYKVVRSEDGSYSCGCKNFIFRQKAQGGHCKHITEVITLGRPGKRELVKEMGKENISKRELKKIVAQIRKRNKEGGIQPPEVPNAGVVMIPFVF